MAFDEIQWSGELPLSDYDRWSEEGRQAYLAGQGKDACPYLRGTREWECWREGYEN